MTGPPPHDPDYRFTLANERTFLAWLRTALALLAAGVAVVQLLPEFGIAGARRTVGVMSVALGIAVAAAAIRRWRRVQQFNWNLFPSIPGFVTCSLRHQASSLEPWTQRRPPGR